MQPANSRYSKEYAFSLFLFLLSFVLIISAFVPSGTAIMVVYTIGIIVFSFVYGLHLSKNINPIFIDTSFIANTILFIIVATLYLDGGQIGTHSFRFVENFVAYMGIFIILLFLANIFAYSERKSARAAVLVTIIVIALCLYYSPLVIKYVVDDETLIGYYATLHLLSGINPYTQSISQLLYKSHNSIGATLETSNQLAGVVGYPALFFLVQVPFYMLFAPTQASLSSYYIHAQGTIFFMAMVFSLILITKRTERNNLFRQNWLLYLAFGIMSLTLSSMMVFLMAALVLMLYTEIGEKYPWIFLGLAAALQEQLWVIVIMFMVYYFNNYGIRKGGRTLLGTGAVFLLINGYFVVSSPSSYINSVLTTLESIVPTYSAAIGYFIASSYPIALQDYTYVFLMAIALMAILFAYINKKAMIPIFGTLPLLFIDHGIPIYLASAVFIFAAVYHTDFEGETEGRLRHFARSSRARAAAVMSAFALLVFAMIVFIQYSHSSYISSFDPIISNQSAALLNNGNIEYSASLTYSGVNNTNVYLMLTTAYANTYSYWGLYNQSLIKDSLICNYYPCGVNTNKLLLYNATGRKIEALIPSNFSAGSIGYVSAILYNGHHYYQTIPVRVK